MSEAGIKLPNGSVLDALFRKFLEVKEKTSSLAGELGDRLKTQYDRGDLDPYFWSIYSKVRKKSVDNELRAREMIDQGRAALDMAEQHINARGHVGDIAKMAQDAEKKNANALPLDQAGKALEANAHKAPTPAQVEDLAARRAAKRKAKKDGEAKEQSGEEEDVRPRHLIENEKQRESEAKGEEPDLPAVPERRKKGSGLDGTTAAGSYKLQ